MKKYKFTKVWIIDKQLVVADTAIDAVALFKSCKGENWEPEEIKCLRANVGIDGFNALIKGDEQ